MDLPKVNERRFKSEQMRSELALAILRVIEKVEKENDYKFEPYEIDIVLLREVERRHQSYILSKFGDQMT